MPTKTPPTRPKNGTSATYQNPSAQHPRTINVAPAPRNVLRRPNCVPSVAKCQKTLSTRRRLLCCDVAERKRDKSTMYRQKGTAAVQF